MPNARPMPTFLPDADPGLVQRYKQTIDALNTTDPQGDDLKRLLGNLDVWNPIVVNNDDRFLRLKGMFVTAYRNSYANASPFPSSPNQSDSWPLLFKNHPEVTDEQIIAMWLRDCARFNGDTYATWSKSDGFNYDGAWSYRRLDGTIPADDETNNLTASSGTVTKGTITRAQLDAILDAAGFTR